MKIAVDFDNTITTNKPLWKEIIKLFTSSGYEVKIITARVSYGTYQDNLINKNSDIFDFSAETGIDIIFCCGEQKSDYYKADIWIDDYPLGIPSLEAINEFKEQI